MNTYCEQLLLNDKPHPFMVTMFKMRYPEFADLEKRLKSFEGHAFEIPVEEIAEAGMFARGIGAICFYCGGGIHSIEPGENAWEEHAFWFRRCPYVLTMKGTNFVNAVIDKKKKNKTCKLEGKPMETSVDPTCKVCLTNVADVLYLPCKHLASCRSCKVYLEKCPICRTKCDSIIVVYHT